jgi:hypothetical protein
MGKLTGTRHGDAANDLLTFYSEKATELEDSGQFFMAAIALGGVGFLEKKCRLLSLLRQADFANQLGVARIGAQRIEREVSPEGDQTVVFLVCGVEPLEGMVLVA